MKKVIFIIIASSILSACLSTPSQPTVAPEATPTLSPPTPTETLVPPTLIATSAAETISLGGVTLTLDENGVAIAMEVEGNYTVEQKAEKMAAVDPTNWGFEPGEAQIIKGEDGKIFMTPVGEPKIKMASWYGSEWLWDWSVMNAMEDGNPLFDFAKTFATNDSGGVRVTKEVRADAEEIRTFAPGYPIYLYDRIDKTESIIATYRGDEKLDPNEMIKSKQSEIVDGWIGFKTKSGEIVKMRFKDIEVFIRGFN